MPSIFVFALLCLTSLPALAQTQDPILSLPDGQVILNISATERSEVAQHLVNRAPSYAMSACKA